MNDTDRLKKMLEDSKEDAPVSVKMFREFIDNHYTHLKIQTLRNTKLLWIILGVIIAAALADRF